MSKNIGYVRVSTSSQELDNQKHQVLDYCNTSKVGSVEFIEVQISSRKKDEDRKINELLNMLKSGDSLIVTELSRIGRSVINVVEIINRIIDKNVNIHIIKEAMIINPNDQNPFTLFQINIFASFAQLERDLISKRTKEALQARKAMGVVLGRKKGTLSKSIFDEYKDKIMELYSLGLSLQKICSYINTGTQQSLSQYISSRNITKESIFYQK